MTANEFIFDIISRIHDTYHELITSAMQTSTEPEYYEFHKQEKYGEDVYDFYFVVKKRSPKNEN